MLICVFVHLLIKSLFILICLRFTWQTAKVQVISYKQFACCLSPLPKIVPYFPQVVSMTQKCPSSAVFQCCSYPLSNYKETWLSWFPLFPGKSSGNDLGLQFFRIFCYSRLGLLQSFPEGDPRNMVDISLIFVFVLFCGLFWLASFCLQLFSFCHSTFLSESSLFLPFRVKGAFALSQVFLSESRITLPASNIIFWFYFLSTIFIMLKYNFSKLVFLGYPYSYRKLTVRNKWTFSP